MRIFTILLVIYGVLFCQDPREYYPHQMGDTWYYSEYVSGGYTNYYEYVIFDSLGLDGNYYIKIACSDSFPTDKNIQSYDILTPEGKLYRDTISDSTLELDFGAQEGDTILFWYIGDDGFGLVRCDEVGEMVIWGEVRSYKKFTWYLGIVGGEMGALQESYYVAGIGEYMIYPEAGNEIVLMGCRIDSIVYGYFPPVKVEPNTVNYTRQFDLLQNYPNPFNPTTVIPVHLTGATSFSLKIYNLAGQLIATIFEGSKPAGRYQFNWNGMDSNGNPVPSGIYFYQFRSGNDLLQKKLLLIR
ncbi:MAG: hypothetical protein Kow00108_08390 [Calditrichia bacterium]